MTSHQLTASAGTRPTARGALSFLPLGELSLMLLAFALLAMAG